MTIALPTIEIAIEHKNWQVESTYRDLIEQVVEQAVEVAELKYPEESELSILLTGDDQMQSINKQWRQIDKPTNVLSFPGGDVAVGDIAGATLGDVIIAFETVEREAKEEGKSFSDHLTHLVVHGFLHLFGYDHENDREALVMEGMETKILNQLGISDPYQDFA